MEQYIVSARKYRPATFHSVVGQSSLTTTLKNAISTQHLAHAYLFCGPRGVGKTTCARIFAKTINCSNLQSDGEACNECESCRSFNEQRSLNIFEMDAASNNSVDDIRELVKQVMIPPQIGKYRVYIIDEVHMLSAAAFNAFLKTLEEPPSYAVFILATTEKHKILPTIISRCQIYDFNRIQIADTVKYLKYVADNEKITVEEQALGVIAQKADGAMRDALSIFDQIVSFCGDNITYKAVIENLNVLDYEYYFKLVDLFLVGDVVNSLLILNEIINKGFDVQSFVSGLSSHFRDLLVANTPQTLVLLQVSNDAKNMYAEQAKISPPAFLFKALEIANQCELNYRISKNKRLLVELMLIKLCQIVNSEQHSEIKTDLKKIEVGNTEVKPVTVENKPVAAIPQIKPVHTPTVENPNQPIPLVKSNSTINISAFTAPKTQPTESKNSDAQVESNENKAFTQEQLADAWQNFAQTVDNQGFFANFVQNIKPHKDGENCIVSVASSVQLNEFTNNKEKIEKFLSDFLENSNIKLIIEKEETQEQQKKLSPPEILKIMQEKNESIENLISKLDLEIGY